MKTFVDDNFDEEGTEFAEWDPTDWKEDPAFLDDIQVCYKCSRLIWVAIHS